MRSCVRVDVARNLTGPGSLAGISARKAGTGPRSPRRRFPLASRALARGMNYLPLARYSDARYDPYDTPVPP